MPLVTLTKCKYPSDDVTKKSSAVSILLTISVQDAAKLMGCVYGFLCCFELGSEKDIGESSIISDNVKPAVRLSRAAGGPSTEPAMSEPETTA